MIRAAILARVIAPLAALLWLPQAVYACPLCERAVASSGGNVAAGYFWSILFMLSMPFLLVGAYGLLFYRMCRAEARRQAQPAQQEHEPSIDRVDQLVELPAG